jgi:hypothetical protein
LLEKNLSRAKADAKRRERKKPSTRCGDGGRDLPIFNTSIKETCGVTFGDTSVGSVASSIDEVGTLQSAREGDIAVAPQEVR